MNAPARRPRGGAHPSWSEPEKRTLLREWGECGQERLCEKLPGRTWDGIAIQAWKMGLSFGPPQGWEWIYEAARRTGYSWDGLMAVLRRRGVRPISGRTTWRKCRRRRIVRIEDVDRAIAEDLGEWEVVRPAALRRGLVPQTLRQWLIDAGVLVPQKGTRAYVRLRTEVIDRVVAERRAGMEAWHRGERALPYSRPGAVRCTPSSEGAELRTGEGRGRR